MSNRKKISIVSMVHYGRLVYRSALSVALLIRWELTFYLHPERFSENTNEYLRCENCTEKLCAHKKQLKSLWKQVEEYTSEKIRRLKK